MELLESATNRKANTALHILTCKEDRREQCQKAIALSVKTSSYAPSCDQSPVEWGQQVHPLLPAIFK